MVLRTATGLAHDQAGGYALSDHKTIRRQGDDRLQEMANRTAADLVASLLGALGPGDRFNLAACDVDCHWVFDEPVVANKKNLNAARTYLDARVSLGWTDLAGAFRSALARCSAHTHLVYLGDGIGTTVDADPVALAQSLERIYRDSSGTCHAPRWMRASQSAGRTRGRFSTKPPPVM